MTTLQWEQRGEGDRTLVWGHGLTSSRQGDDESPLSGLASSVVAAGWRLVRYDARGHGTSPKPADTNAYRWDVLANDMLAIADAAGAEHFVAAGASMGAATSLHAALLAPGRIDALVLVIPPTAWETRAAQRQMYEVSAGIVEAKGIDHLLAQSKDLPPTTFFGEAGQERSRRNLAAMDPQIYPFVMRGAAGSNLPEPDAIAGIGAPTLLLAWTDDPTHPVSTAERLDELLPTSELQVATSPEEVATWPRLVAEFLNDRAASPLSPAPGSTPRQQRP